jgi:hypothetical protein
VHAAEDWGPWSPRAAEHERRRAVLVLRTVACHPLPRRCPVMAALWGLWWVAVWYGPAGPAPAPRAGRRPRGMAPRAPEEGGMSDDDPDDPLGRAALTLIGVYVLGSVLGWCVIGVLLGVVLA